MSLIKSWFRRRFKNSLENQSITQTQPEKIIHPIKYEDTIEKAEAISNEANLFNFTNNNSIKETEKSLNEVKEQEIIREKEQPKELNQEFAKEEVVKEEIYENRFLEWVLNKLKWVGT